MGFFSASAENGQLLLLPIFLWSELVTWSFLVARRMIQLPMGLVGEKDQVLVNTNNINHICPSTHAMIAPLCFHIESTSLAHSRKPRVSFIHHKCVNLQDTGAWMTASTLGLFIVFSDPKTGVLKGHYAIIERGQDCHNKYCDRMIDPLYPFHPLPPASSTLFSVSLFLFGLVCSLILFVIFHICVRSYGSCSTLHTHRAVSLHLKYLTNRNLSAVLL